MSRIFDNSAESKLILGGSGDEYWIEKPLLKILGALTRIPIVCLHHEMWSFKHHRPRLLDSARAGKLQFLLLGEHTRTLAMEESLIPWTQNFEDGFNWVAVPTDVYIPVSLSTLPYIAPFLIHIIKIFPLPESVTLPSRARLAKEIVPNDVAIIGNVDNHGWRRYTEFWADLMKAIQGELHHPAAFG